MIAAKSIYREVEVKKIPLTFEKSKKNSFFERFQAIIIITDLILLNVNLTVWYNVLASDITIYNYNKGVFLTFIILANIFLLTVALFNDTYKFYEIIRPVKKVQTLLSVHVIYFAILTSCYYYFFFPILNTNFLFPVFLSFLFTSIPMHLFFRSYYKQKMPALKYAVVGGKPYNLEFIQETFSRSFGNKSNCIGWFGKAPLPSVRWLGNYSELKRFIKHSSFDKLYYIYSDLTRAEVKNIIELCESRFIDFEIVPRELDIITGNVRVLNQGQFPILAPQKEPLQRLRNKTVKRVFDICFSLGVVLLIIPWLFPIIALLIKLESKGPVFFIQKRTGYWNRVFNCIKFRTMVVHEEKNQYQQAIKNDTRITKIGAFLRKTNLDEFPQFINVLKGEMSIVGPRPHPIKLNEESSKLIETFMVRHRAKPGITGWAQIHGHRGPTDTTEKMRLRVQFDAHYIKNWTFFKDIYCVLRTVTNMLKGEKNAF